MLDAGIAIKYSAIAAACCLAIALIETTVANKTGLPMVRVDSKNWFVNGLISLSIGVTFIFVGLIKGSQWSRFIPYADPTIVTIFE